MNHLEDYIDEYIVPSIICVPLTVIFTFLTPFFWHWFEKTTGISSIGHFGPAIWCFVVVYALQIAGFSIYKNFFQKRILTGLMTPNTH